MWAIQEEASIESETGEQTPLAALGEFHVHERVLPNLSASKGGSMDVIHSGKAVSKERKVETRPPETHVESWTPLQGTGDSDY